MKLHAPDFHRMMNSLHDMQTVMTHKDLSPEQIVQLAWALDRFRGVIANKRVEGIELEPTRSVRARKEARRA